MAWTEKLEVVAEADVLAEMLPSADCVPYIYLGLDGHYLHFVLDQREWA